LKKITIKQIKIQAKSPNHKADISNGNKGTNITYAKAQENKGKQMNPNPKKFVVNLIL